MAGPVFEVVSLARLAWKIMGVFFVPMYQLYTSSEGGKTFFPDVTSDMRKRFRFRKSFEVISSFSTLNQLSCRVSISSFRRDFCSSVRLLIHLSLSKVVGAGSVGGLEGLVLEVEGLVFGGPKNEVIEELALGFFTSAAATAASAALRLRDIGGWEVDVVVRVKC